MVKVLIINLPPLDSNGLTWKFPLHLLPKLLHGALGVVQGDVQGVGHGLIEGELGFGIPAFLVGPGSLCNVSIDYTKYRQNIVLKSGET